MLALLHECWDYRQGRYTGAREQNSNPQAYVARTSSVYALWTTGKRGLPVTSYLLLFGLKSHPFVRYFLTIAKHGNHSYLRGVGALHVRLSTVCDAPLEDLLNSGHQEYVRMRTRDGKYSLGRQRVLFSQQDSG